jgi:hypothetical protein
VLYKTFTVAIISRPLKFAILGFSGGEMPMLWLEKNPGEGDECFGA